VSDPLRLVVLGMMGRAPFGGQTWLYLNWLRALDRLGHEVWYVEDDIVWAYDPRRNAITDDFSYAVAHVRQAMESIGLGDRWAFRFALEPRICAGLAERELDALYRSCDALLNVVGATELREAHLAAPYRVYVETDPVTVELKYAAGVPTEIRLHEHHALATYGENYGARDCGVPLNGHRFAKTRQPIDLESWPAAFDAGARAFTTIGNYRQDGSDVEWNGETYRWSKDHEWQRFLSLPRRVQQEFDVALVVRDREDRHRLLRHGWRLSPPLPFTLDALGAYRDWFRRSRGEFTVAKDQNVRLRSGWFSERAACYLATGKPVVMQDTGFANVLPTGRGLFAVSDEDEAADAIAAINADYRAHCLAARELAEDHFEGRAVARRLLEDVGLA